MNIRQEALNPSPHVQRWTEVLWRLLRWVPDAAARAELLGWLLAYVHHVSGGNPTHAKSAKEGALYGLAALSLDQYGKRLKGVGPESQLELLNEKVCQLTGKVWRAGYGPTLLLCLFVSPYSAQRWVMHAPDTPPHVESYARVAASLAPLAAAYQTWVLAWLGCSRPRIRTVFELPLQAVRWQTRRGKKGVWVSPSWRGVVELACPTFGAQVAPVPPAEVVFKLAGQTRYAPGPSLEEAARLLLLEAENLPSVAAARLARALGINAPEGSTLGQLKALLVIQSSVGASR